MPLIDHHRCVRCHCLRPAFVFLFLALTVSVLSAQQSFQPKPVFDREVERQLDQIPFDGRASYEYLRKICEIGPRVTGSKGMTAQRDLLAKVFQDLGAKVFLQSFAIRHPVNGEAVEVGNLIVHWHPERKRRVLICTHFDTRPYPDSDLRNPRGEFIGANDGGSGTALLCQLGKYMPDLKSEYGVDFVFFDAEEFVFEQRGAEYFIGSTHFAKDYAANPPEFRYEFGILLDMIGDANLNLYFEKNSLQHAGQLTRSIWQTARRLRVSEFTPRLRHTVRDDHLPLNEIAKIPTSDIIDFDYPQPGANFSYWHTQQDTIDKCSPLSLAKVGWVLHQWLQDLK